MPSPLWVLLVICIVGLVWAAVALGRGDAGGEPKRRQQWRIASIVAVVFVVAMVGGYAVGQNIF